MTAFKLCGNLDFCPSFILWVTQLPKKGTKPPIFGSCLLWPNGCIDQDATWYGGRLRPRPHCASWAPNSHSPKRGHSPQFSIHVCCGQTAGRIKMSLGTKVGFSQGHIVLHGETAAPSQKGQSSNFRPMSIVAKQSPISGTAEYLLLELKPQSQKRGSA